MMNITGAAKTKLLFTLAAAVVIGGCSGMRSDRVSVSDRDPTVENRFTSHNSSLDYTTSVPSLGYANEVREDHPDSYTVVRGDTLWDISGRFLKKPWLWPQIWEYNPSIENPHLIYPGDQIALEYVDGELKLVVSRNGQRLTGSRTSAGGPSNKLSPKIRAESLADAIPTIPGDAISQFLVYPRVVTAKQLADAPYVIGNYDGRLTSAAGHQIYARGPINPNQSTYGVFRRSKVLKDPETGELLGYEVMHVSTAKLLQHADPSTLLLTSNKMETLADDRLMSNAEVSVAHSYIPRLPKIQGSGRIISLVDAIAQSGRNQIVVLNLGEEAGVQIGDVMGIEQRGGTILDRFRGREKVELPDMRTGVLMVFQTFEKVSYALVMESTRPIHINDLVTDL